MAWGAIQGHDFIVRQFRTAVQRGRLASTFLFVGAPGIGKRSFAIRLAQALLCDTNEPSRLEPCEHCAACQQVAAGTHPDLEFIAKPPDKAFLPLELFIGDAEHRMRAGLCYNISLKPFSGKRRIAIIDDADYFNVEGANSLLKTLEEPPPQAMILLLGTSEQRQLPTIRSRSQIIRFQPLPAEILASLLIQQRLVTDDQSALEIAECSGGSLEKARELLDDSWQDFRKELLDSLARLEFDAPSLVKTANSVVDAAGKDAALKRQRLKQIIQQAIDFYRLVLRGTVEENTIINPLTNVARETLRWWPGNAEAASLCLESCMQMQSAVDSNAGTLNILECWFDELGTIARTGQALTH